MSSAEYKPVPYCPERVGHEDSIARGQAFYDSMDERRSVRFFSDDPVPQELIELAIKTASTAPSGAHRQPWTFVVVSDPEVKKQIRIAAEDEERKSYEGGRMPEDWIKALAPLGTDWRKSYLETVPYIVVQFEQITGFDEAGAPQKNYYVRESCGIAAGMFIAAIHQMGLSTLTHTPSPMGFLSRILGRPKNERPFILYPIGYPAADATVPDIARKPLDQVSVWNPKPSED